MAALKNLWISYIYSKWIQKSTVSYIIKFCFKNESWWRFSVKNINMIWVFYLKVHLSNNWNTIINIHIVKKKKTFIWCWWKNFVFCIKKQSKTFLKTVNEFQILINFFTYIVRWQTIQIFILQLFMNKLFYN